MPLSLPLPRLTLAEMLMPAPPEPYPMPTPTLPPLLSFLPSSSWVFCAERRYRSRLAASVISLPAFSWLPSTVRSPSAPRAPLPVAITLRSRPALRVLP
ncbi:hypothetical protein D3C76_1490430 [compost metagenome]